MAAVALYFQREQLAEIISALARNVKNETVFNDIRMLPARADAAPLPEPLHEQLSGVLFWDAVQKAVDYGKFVAPNYIIGLNFGGRLLSTFLATQLNISDDHCLYMESAKEVSEGFVLHNGDKTLSGSILIVDDISRTGVTLERAKIFLEDMNFLNKWNIEKAYFAVLVVVSNSELPYEIFRPDFVGYRTEVFHFGMPWSETNIRIRLNRELLKQFPEIKKGVDKTAIQTYNKVIDDAQEARDIFLKFAGPNSLK